MPWAIENGGAKLDNFNSSLSDMYQRYGFIPVSRCPFADEFAPDGWNFARDGRPDIVFMVHNGDSVDEVIRKRKEGLFTIIDPTTTPLFDDYGAAMEFRDKILEERLKK